ncbi:MAG TPA: DUF6058 family natural product biosynthesis protein [Gammaproteobacteria bacterium]|nr:DUF6058 family natural product biosynthesis protein [Gammaproteobacteria bacterium]
MNDCYAMSEADIAYVRRQFHRLDTLAAAHGYGMELVRGWIERGSLPRPTYILPDDSEWVPENYFTLFECADNEPAALRERFIGRWLTEMTRLGEDADADIAAREWESYLSGVYGLCLKEVSPENIARKERLVGRLTAALAAPRPADPAWRRQLRDEVAALDALERPFTDCDRVRLGGPVSRDRLIDAPRQDYPDLFASVGEADRGHF